MDALVISALQPADKAIEVVERKGLGHPDSICDALAEKVSRDLCREYLRRFGEILHHNVDKALLCGGRAAPALGGGDVLAPIRIYLAGRATSVVGGEAVPVEEIAIENSRQWLSANLHALDVKRHVEIYQHIQPGSTDLQALFSSRGGGGVVRANDTSIGVGYAPLSRLERTVLAIEQRMNANDHAARHPARGEDVKVMGIRRGAVLDLTVSCALIGSHLAHKDDYLGEKSDIAALVREVAAEQGFADCNVVVNAADLPASDRIYLTVTGTSAEAGDDGQVGRGNRANGLITPCRPMSLEAVAGKNPVSHVGKTYNVIARNVAEALVAASSEIVRAECLLVSRIGAPVTEPAIIQIKLATADGVPVARFKMLAEDIAADCLGRLPLVADAFVAGTLAVC